MEGAPSHTAATSPSLSPLFPLISDQNQQPQQNRLNENAISKTAWLANPSFEPKILSSIKYASAPPPVPEEEIQEEEKEVEAKHTYEILETSSSDEVAEPYDSKRRRKRRKLDDKRKRKKIDRKDEGRASKVKIWADSDVKLTKDYYFDGHGDPDNLVFGSLYRMDVPRYRVHQLPGLAPISGASFIAGTKNLMVWDAECDSIFLDDKANDECRYCSSKFLAFERRKDIKRIRIFCDVKLSLLPSEDFIPLREEQEEHEDEVITGIASNTRSQSEISSGETWDEFVMRRTKEFNLLTRDKPQDENVWISFANFQDQLIAGQRKKSVQLSALEKKISILEKALECNPDSEELLLMLLDTYRKHENTSTLIQKWEKALIQHSGSYRLWKSFINLCQGDFSLFTVSKIREVYGHALQALSSTCNQLLQKGLESYEGVVCSKEFLEIEQALVDVFVGLCKSEWQTGHKELCIGLMQAEIEYTLFSPALNLSEQNKKRLFEYFWNSGGARIGEPGALGWAVWLEREEQQRQSLNMLSSVSKVEEEGGWTGWSDLPFSAKSGLVENVKEADNIQPSDNESEDDDMGELENNDDYSSLLQKLGLDLDSGKEVEVKDTKIWKKWADEELSRDREQWLPLHTNTAGIDASMDFDNEDGDQLSRTILFEDIRDFLFSLKHEEARLSLILQIIDFFNFPLKDWTCTNSATWKDKLVSLDSLDSTSFEVLKSIEHGLSIKDSDATGIVFQTVCGRHSNIHENEDYAKFLHNMLLQCNKVFPNNSCLKNALLNVVAYTRSDTNSDNRGINAIRDVAKKLLRTNRQDLLLCGAYASIEAAAGNVDAARKVFDKALMAAGSLSMDYQLNAPLLYLLYAEAELANATVSSEQRAIHVLSFLACNENYQIYSPGGPVSNTRILKARRGFKENIQSLRLSWIKGDIQERSSALIACSALFEELTSGWEAAARIFEDAFSMLLPGRRHTCFHIEWLYLRYIQMLEKHRSSLTPLQAWKVISQACNQYPYNSKFYKSLICSSPLPAFTFKIRRLFDELCQRNPSSLLWLFALFFEIGKPDSGPRIHRLFEQALNNPETRQSVVLWRCYLAYELYIQNNTDAARRIFFRAVHACPWSKLLWLEGFQKLNNILTAKELSDLQEVMREKELRLRTDIYEILLEDETKIL